MRLHGAALSRWQDAVRRQTRNVVLHGRLPLQPRALMRSNSCRKIPCVGSWLFLATLWPPTLCRSRIGHTTARCGEASLHAVEKASLPPTVGSARVRALSGDCKVSLICCRCPQPENARTPQNDRSRPVGTYFVFHSGKSFLMHRGDCAHSQAVRSAQQGFPIGRQVITHVRQVCVRITESFRMHSRQSRCASSQLRRVRDPAERRAALHDNKS